MARTYHHHIGRPQTADTFDVTVGPNASTLSDAVTQASVYQRAPVDASDIHADPPIIGGLVASDSFNRANDATSLGTADSGGAWTNAQGTFQIVSNTARIVAVTANAPVVAMLPTALQTGTVMVDVVLSPTAGNTGLVLRGTDANSYMVAQIVASAAQNVTRIGKRVSGASTYWVTTTSAGWINGRGYTLALIVTSTGTTFYVDGAQVGTYTFTSQDNTDLPGQLIGLRSWDGANDETGGSYWDNYSASNSTTLTPRAPAIPLAPTASVASATSASLTWVPAGNGCSALTSYTVRASTGQTYTGIAGSATSYTATGLTTGTPVTFTLQVANAVGSSVIGPASNSVTPITVTVPGAPTIGTAVALDAAANVAFTPPASNGGAAIDYYQTASNPATTAVTGASSPITHTGLSNGTPYTFQVRAHNSVGLGPYSSSSNSVTPQSSGSTKPDASNTGPRTSMTTTTGDKVYSTNGQTITGLLFSSLWVNVTGNNITFRDCQFIERTDPNYGSRGLDVPGANILFEYCKIGGCYIPDGGNATFRYCEFEQTFDGGDIMGLGGSSGNSTANVTVDQCWFHNVRVSASSGNHVDCIQMRGSQAVTITGNNFDCAISDTDPSVMYYNSVLYADDNDGGSGQNLNVVVDGNWIHGGGYTIYEFSGSRFHCTNNKFGDDYAPHEGQDNAKGLWYAGNASGFQWSNNTWDTNVVRHTPGAIISAP